MHHLAVPPDADFHNLLDQVRNQVDFDFFAEIHSWHFDRVVEQRDPSISINDPGFTQAKDVFGRCIWLGQGEWAEKAVALVFRSFEADVGNLFGGGVDLVVVVAVYFILEDSPNIFHG